jgi:hypothetical protein
MAFAVASCVAASGVAFIASSPAVAFSMGPVMILYSFHLIWKLLFLSDALRRLHHDHRSGALELLLTTPIDPGQILRAQVSRTWRVFLPGAIGLFLANLMWYWKQDARNEFSVIPIGAALFLLIDGVTLCWVAMAQAFKPNRFPAAVLRLAAKVIFIPLLSLWLVLMSGKSWSSAEFNSLFIFWFTACAFYDGILIARAKRELHNLRQLASNEPPAVKTVGRPAPKFVQWLLLSENRT